MLTPQQKMAHFHATRNRNYRASLRLEGFKVETTPETALDQLTPAQILQRIQQIKSRYAE